MIRSNKQRMRCGGVLAAALAAQSVLAAGPLADVLQPFVDRHELAGAGVLAASKDKGLDVEAVGDAFEKAAIDRSAQQPAETANTDWARLAFYRDANAALPRTSPRRVVFIGDSITQAWAAQPFIRDNPNFVGRGIGGQTAAQILVRVPQDVVDLKPAVVHIMAGTNDVAENTGPETDAEIQGYISRMAELARASGIKVVLASIPPAADFPWRRGLNPAPRIKGLNAWIRDYAARNGFTYVDYWPVLATSDGAMKSEFSPDGVHPNAQGYAAMQPLTAVAIQRALNGAVDGGYVAGNFGIAAQMAERDGLVAKIKINPPRLGTWLEDFAEGRLWIAKAGFGDQRLKLRSVRTRALYPQYRATFEVGESATVEVRAFAPLGLNSALGFLPALIVETKLRSPRPWAASIGYTLTPKDAAAPAAEMVRSVQLAGLVQGGAFLGLTGVPAETIQTDASNGLSVSAAVNLTSGSERTLTFVLGSYDSNGRYANEYGSAPTLLAGLVQRAGALGKEFDEFVASLPRTGDRDIDAYLRWYTSAGILLTKGLRTGEVLTMGYTELNQRDSFWSSGVHLVFWKDLERKMLLETVQAQAPSGHIPVCILPLIDRGDELDSAEYFILRAARYFRWYRDRQFLAKVWPAVKKAIDYLASRDIEKIGVPMQTSFWADWKDIRAVEGRKYAPHFDLLWVAALKEAAQLAEAAHDAEAAADYERLKIRAESFVNRPFEQGGLWNGKNYVDRWEGGRQPDYVLLDQAVGAYFEVIPKERLQSIYRQLQPSETAYGVRETYPYAPYSSGFHPSDDIPGNYHNGGIWPWLDFMDVKGRYAHGYTADAERIIHEVGKADLEAEGDYQPGEFMNGDTGRNLGYPIQAWDAALFSAIYFGAFGLERVSDSEIHIRVRTPRERDFSTRLILPGTTGVLSRRSGRLRWKQDPGKAANRPTITVKLLDERKEIP